MMWHVSTKFEQKNCAEAAAQAGMVCSLCPSSLFRWQATLGNMKAKDFNRMNAVSPLGETLSTSVCLSVPQASPCHTLHHAVEFIRAFLAEFQRQMAIVFLQSDAAWGACSGK
jgi:hypothetical protein